jgi:5-methylcytosine-specific restriction enzyme subunit McrC
MGQWLFNILKDNTLVDNQYYRVSDGMLNNIRLSQPIRLNRRSHGQWWQPWNDENAIWEFLNTTSEELANLFANKTQNSIVLFNNLEYEHNTEDSLIDISGINCMNFTMKTGNIIGYVKRGDYSMKISSRFGDNFLKYIISDADGFFQVDNYGGESKDEGYEWLLIYLWKVKMKKAYRLGLPKKYVSKQENLNTIRGNIDSVDYFLNGRNTGRYKCEYREHSYNNEATQLMAETFRKIGNHDFLKDTTLLKNAIYTATNGEKRHRRELYNVRHFTNPFYKDYNEVIDLSKLILRDELTDFGEQSENSAFFFDVSMLFEYFVRKLIKRIGLVVENKFENRQQIATGITSYNRKLEPDIVFEHGNNKFVFDVKYKSFDFTYGVNREDLFQLHTYVGQYGNRSKIKACGFIYPISEAKWAKHQEHLDDCYINDEVQIMGSTIKFYILFIKVPENNSEEFNKEFKSNCEIFLENVSNIIN